jgi:serine/threonine protein kinase
VSPAPGEMTSQPSLERQSLRKAHLGQGAPGQPPFPQMPPPSTDSLLYQGTAQRAARVPGHQVTDSLPHDIAAPSTPNRFDAPHINPRPAQPSFTTRQGFQRAAGVGGQESMVSTPIARALLPGTLLRGNRYRLQELVERQDWLSGVFEGIWIGKDAQRNSAKVIITEVVLPEGTSVMSQTLLRTATMALANVGRHRHIPALWDAFSDHGRSFFIFEPIEGESFFSRLRFSGRPLPEQEVIECCIQMTEVLELLAQQSPPLVHGLIRPEHIVIGRESAQYYLTNFSVVLAGGGTQFIAGIERSHLSQYAAPEFTRGVIDTRSDIYSLIASAYFASTGTVPTGISGSIPPARRINNALSADFDAILSKGLRTIASQRYQRPSELRQDLLALRSVNGSIVAGNVEQRMSSGGAFGPERAAQYMGSNIQPQAAQQAAPSLAQALPIQLVVNDQSDEQDLLLPRPENLPPFPAGNDRLNAALLLGLILVALLILVIVSQTAA